MGPAVHNRSPIVDVFFYEIQQEKKRSLKLFDQNPPVCVKIVAQLFYRNVLLL